jgi:hypothetical protein
MAYPKGLFTANLTRVANPKPATRPFSSQAVRVSGMENPRSVFRSLRQPDLPKPESFKKGA